MQYPSRPSPRYSAESRGCGRKLIKLVTRGHTACIPSASRAFAASMQLFRNHETVWLSSVSVVEGFALSALLGAGPSAIDRESVLLRPGGMGQMSRSQQTPTG